jgi:two-component system, OmpR family, response regulator MtrA
MTSIMVVDDDQDLAEMLSIVLNGAGYEVDLVGSGDLALEMFQSQNPDLLLLDVMLPGKDGIEVCREIRNISLTPIVMLTAKTDTTDVVAGLEAGADDYIVKPFTESELLARVKARLRRAVHSGGQFLSVGDIQIDLAGHKVKRNNKEIALTRLEFDLLVALVKEPGRVFTREDLLSEVWGYRPATDTRLVNVHVQRLRAKVEDDPEDPKLVLTVRGIGYKAGPRE